MCNICIPILSRQISLTNEKIVTDRNSANLSVGWPCEHTIRNNTILVVYPYYAVHMILLAEYHQHKVIMFFGLHTRLFSQQAGTGYGIIWHSRAGWRCNTGVYTRGLLDTKRTFKVLSITSITVQGSISVSLFTKCCCYCWRHGQMQCEYAYHYLVQCHNSTLVINCQPKHDEICKMPIIKH